MTPHDKLDDEVAKAIEVVPFDELTAEILPSLRAITAAELALSDAVERVDHLVPGDPEVPVRVHRPKGADGVLPCVYSMHGGGYVLGTYATDDPLFDELCPKLGLVGVSVDYRLAPEAHYPAPLSDCYRGLRWTHEHAPELGIDRGCIGVRGVSAGGGLAAALALLARDRPLHRRRSARQPGNPHLRVAHQPRVGVRGRQPGAAQPVRSSWIVPQPQVPWSQLPRRRVAGTEAQQEAHRSDRVQRAPVVGIC